MKVASSIFNRLKEKVAGTDEAKKQKKHRWRIDKTINVKVSAESILSLKDEEIRSCGLSRAKVLYIKDLSEKVKSSKLKIESLDKLKDEEVTRKLVEVKGIGEWTAQMFLMFTLARPDVFPVEDLGLRNAFKKVVGKNMNKEKLEKFAMCWRPYRTVASWYLWKSSEK
jgi:DNA-3-methyladenine glycosylase II